MSRYVGQIMTLMDGKQQQIGQIRIERQEEEILYGTFVPSPAFPSIEQLFREFEAAVDAQALQVVETLDAAIAALGLHLRWPDTGETIAVHDVQIWSDGTITCRLEQPVSSTKATPQAKLSRRTAEKRPIFRWVFQLLESIHRVN